MNRLVFLFVAAVCVVGAAPAGRAADVCKTICLTEQDWANLNKTGGKHWWCPGVPGLRASSGSGCPLGKAFRDRCGDVCLPAGSRAVLDFPKIHAHYEWKF